jgi:hypothetical protein
MLGEVINFEKVDECNVEIVRLGYEAMGKFGIYGRRFFRKYCVNPSSCQ